MSEWRSAKADGSLQRFSGSAGGLSGKQVPTECFPVPVGRISFSHSMTAKRLVAECLPELANTPGSSLTTCE